LDEVERDIALGLADGDLESLGIVLRWISRTLSSPRFWSLRSEWPDLQQEVVMRVVESLRLGRYDRSREFRLYVQGIARFTALQVLEKKMQARTGPLPPDLPEGEAPDWERRVSSRQAARWVLDNATPECRSLFVDYYFKELSYADIAESRALPVGTIKSRLFRCLEAASRWLRGSDPRGNRRAPRVNTNRTEEQP